MTPCESCPVRFASTNMLDTVWASASSAPAARNTSAAIFCKYSAANTGIARRFSFAIVYLRPPAQSSLPHKGSRDNPASLGPYQGTSGRPISSRFLDGNCRGLLRNGPTRYILDHFDQGRLFRSQCPVLLSHVS